jgi:hypothetical protein
MARDNQPRQPSRRAFLAGGAGLLAGLSAPPARGQGDRVPMRFFRIGTASTGGTYFPIGGLLANAISHPPGSRACADGGSCGVPGLIAVAQSTRGSVDNVRQMATGKLDSAFVQADVAYWAYHGERMFAGQGRMPNLRVIANLYPEAVHLVVRTATGIFWMDQLVAKRLSLDRPGSGTRVDAKVILDAYGVSIHAIDDVAVPAAEAADMMRERELDGFFFVGGAPATAIADLAEDVSIRLVPMNNAQAQVLTQTYPFFTMHSIPAGTYQNVPQTDTLAVGAQWLVDESVPDEVVYGITRALWHQRTAQLLADGHPKAADIKPETALDGLGIPIHAGAWQYYKDKGFVSPDARQEQYTQRIDVD